MPNANCYNIHTAGLTAHTTLFTVFTFVQNYVPSHLFSAEALAGSFNTKGKSPKALICCRWNARQELPQIQCSQGPDLHLFVETEDKAAARNAFTPSETDLPSAVQ